VEALNDLARALTPKERAFAEAYAGSARGNATKAAEMAGYRAGKIHTLTSIGSENLRKPDIRAYVDALLMAHSRSQAEVIREVSDIAFQDLGPYLSHGRIDLDRMRTDGKLHLIAGFEFNKRGNSVAVPHSKLAALTLLVKVLGMGSEKVEHSGTIGVTIREYPEGV
jgi:hypothetical protein